MWRWEYRPPAPRQVLPLPDHVPRPHQAGHWPLPRGASLPGVPGAYLCLRSWWRHWPGVLASRGWRQRSRDRWQWPGLVRVNHRAVSTIYNIFLALNNARAASLIIFLQPRLFCRCLLHRDLRWWQPSPGPRGSLLSRQEHVPRVLQWHRGLGAVNIMYKQMELNQHVQNTVCKS